MGRWDHLVDRKPQELKDYVLDEVADRIAEVRTRLRAEHGWIMDTYLLRRRRASDTSDA